MNKKNLMTLILGICICVFLSSCSSSDSENENPSNPTEITSVIEDPTPFPTSVDISEKTPTEGADVVTTTPEPTKSVEELIKRPDENEVKEFDVTVELGQYKGLEVSYNLKKITDEDVQNELDKLRNMYPDKESIGDQEIKPGDVLRIDYEGVIVGEKYITERGYFTEVTIPDQENENSFDYELIGHKIGDTIELSVTYTSDYSIKPELAGKTVNYYITITDGYNYVPAEVTDEFIYITTGYTSVQEYKDDVKNILQENENNKANLAAEDELIDKILAGCTFSGEIDEEIEYNYQKMLEYNDSEYSNDFYKNAADYFADVYQMTKQEYLDSIKLKSERTAKFDHVLLTVAEKEGITLTQEEFDAEAAALFGDNYSDDPEAPIFEIYSKEVVDKLIVDTAFKEKALALIMENTKFVGA